jgi:mRNA interferase YafQ
MRTIKQSGSFKRDLKRESKGPHAKILQQEFVGLIAKLANDQPLEPRYRDHVLTGNWKDHRDCHVKPDLVLIYSKPDNTTLQLVRLGSHAELRL